jgi:hypothetical protein
VPSGNQSVTATNNAGGQSTSSFTVTPDSAPPSGGTVSYAGGYTTASSVSVSFTQGTDAGSGLVATSGLLQRSSATLSNGACGTFGAFTTVAVNPASPIANAVTAGCYQYRYLISDNVGNQATYTNLNIVKVDQAAPTNSLTITAATGSALSADGATLYYNRAAAGSFRFVNAVADDASGPASATFPAVATTGWVHNAETVSTPAGGPYTSSVYSWTTNPGNPGPLTLAGTDAAGTSTSKAVTFISDVTAPSGGSISYPNAIVNSASVPITLVTGTDAGSGIDPATTVVKRNVATLTTATETCGAFAPTYATTVTLVGGADTSVSSGNCYEYQYIVSDRVGNATTYTSANVVRVDTSGPQVTAIASGAPTNGKLEVGDQLILTFDQALAAASVPTSFANATEISPSQGNVTLTIPGITAGPLNTGSPLYVTSLATATFNGTVALVNNGTATTVTVTVTALTGGATHPSSGTLVFTPAASIKDGGGNSATSTFTTASTFKLF